MLNYIKKYIVFLFLYGISATHKENKTKCKLNYKEPCLDLPYRSIDGSCNNLLVITYGKSNWPFRRLTQPTYSDDNNGIPQQTDGTPYPSAREISNLLYPTGNVDSKNYTLALMQFLQLVTHDMALGDGILAGLSASLNPIGCCFFGKYGKKSNETICAADIVIPPKDPDYGAAEIQCLGFGRTRTTANYFCQSKKYNEQINLSTSYLDMSFIYGSTVATAAKVRQKSGGKLRGVMRNGQLWPPNNLIAETTCIRAKCPFTPCYSMGDPRVNQSPQLTSLHILMWREHNRIVGILQNYNQNWDDETLFQEARRINIAQWQHFVYTEMLPKLLGTKTMLKYGLINRTPGSCQNDYDDSVDSSTLQEFTTGAFRYFHTLIQGQIKTYNNKRELLQNLNLSDWIDSGEVNELNEEVNYDTLLIGLTMQPQAESDIYYDRELKFRFIKNPFNNLGIDLLSFDIERTRDHGLARYVDIRRLCNLSVPTTWQEMVGDLSKNTVVKLKKLYANVESVEYLPASNLEGLLPGTLVGPTHACIIGLQFKLTRTGDRYFYDNCESNKMSSEQLSAIKKVPLARLFCDNSIIEQIQHNVTDIISYSNPVVDCSEIPSLDLSLWMNESNPTRKKNPFNNLGIDLLSFDIERTRDHGLARYVDIRRLCNLSVPTTWQEMVGDLSKNTVVKLKKLYANVESVEYLPASNLEGLLPGTLVGPTHACIIGLQFKLTRTGDRYFYDNCESNKMSSEQLSAIKKVPLARLFCDNSIIEQIQHNVTDIISYSNPVVDCSEIPSLDLSLWMNESNPTRKKLCYGYVNGK